MIVCQYSKRFMVNEQAAEVMMDEYCIMTEPEGMNTSHAILAAALYAHGYDSTSYLCILPVDHVIKSNSLFEESILEASRYLKKHLIVFGIKPNGPNGHFGYILPDTNSSNPTHVDSFVEKPKPEIAQELIDKGALWNSGIYMGSSTVFIEEYKLHQPETFKHVSDSINEIKINPPFICLGDSYTQGNQAPIDKAISEKSKNLATLMLRSDWAEVGNWLQLYELSQKNKTNTVIDGNVVDKESEHCYIRSDGNLVVTIGLKDCLVVQEGDVTLVSKMSEINKLPDLLEELKKEQRKEAESHQYCLRPWGYFEKINADSYYQVKKLIIHPGKSISYQKHHHRSEHWVILKGIAEIKLGNKVKTVYAGESVFVPVGVKHQLTNNQKKDLEIIEVQIGDYLGEDDIIRYDDMFNRKQDEK